MHECIKDICSAEGGRAGVTSAPLPKLTLSKLMHSDKQMYPWMYPSSKGAASNATLHNQIQIILYTVIIVVLTIDWLLLRDVQCMNIII